MDLSTFFDHVSSSSSSSGNMTSVSAVSGVNTSAASGVDTSVVAAAARRYVPFIESSPGEGAFLMVVMVFMVVAGGIGNSLVMLSVALHKRLRNSCNLLIVNLAIADMSVSIFSNPFAIVGLLYGRNFFDQHALLCELIATSCIIACTCSLLTILTVSLNRYIAIVKNQYYDKMFSMKKTLIMCAALWIVSCTVSLPNHFGWGSYAFDDKQLICNSDRLDSLSYNVFFAVVAMLIPVSMVFCLYLAIFCHVSRARLAITTTAGSKDKGQNKNIKLARSLFTIFLAFLICWLPYALGLLVDQNDSWPQAAHIVALQMAHFSSSGLNSFIYAVTQPPFREAYLNIICLGHRKKGNDTKVYVDSTHGSAAPRTE